MFNFVLLLLLSGSNLQPKDFPQTFTTCVQNGGDVYSLSDGSFVCEE